MWVSGRDPGRTWDTPVSHKQTNIPLYRTHTAAQRRRWRDVCPQCGTNTYRDEIPVLDFVQYRKIPGKLPYLIFINGISSLLEPHTHMWGQNTLIISSVSPKRDWGPQRVKYRPSVFRSRYPTLVVSTRRVCRGLNRTKGNNALLITKNGV